MPAPKRTRTPRQAQIAENFSLPGGGTVNAKIDIPEQADPDAIDKITKSIVGSRQGPTTRSQASFVDWDRLANELGQPFDAELVPLSKLRQMRRDPMIGFGLHYIKTPLCRAPWMIKCMDPQVAAFVDQALRPIYARLIFQMTNALDFGFSAISKQFKIDFPQGTFFDENGNEQAVWSEGNVAAVLWKPFVALPPEDVKPAWSKLGEFNGIIFTGEDEGNPGGGGTTGAAASASGGSGNEDKPTIDLFHSLWSTNQKDSVFGSIYGYPRINYAYRYWWSYWFRWALADRAFERFAVPPLIGFHPDGSYQDEEGNRFDNMDLMLEALGEIRSNSDVALPSDVATDDLGNRTTMREWEIKFLEGGNPNMDFHETFNYLDVMKLRSIWVPEQAFVEGEGGTSSRNVAAQMADIFIESQSNLMDEIDDQINRYLIPHLVSLNFPEFIGECRKITTGFSSDDIDLMRQIVSLIGQQAEDPAAAMEIDVRQLMGRFGVPLVSPQEAAQQKQALIDQSALTNPPVTKPDPGVAAGVAKVLKPNATNPTQTVTGFSYFHPGEEINLSTDAEFISRLPDSEHFNDPRVKRSAAMLQARFAQSLAQSYVDIAEILARELGAVELADDPDREGLTTGQKAALAALAAGLTAKQAKQVADEMLAQWDGTSTAGPVLVASAGAALLAVLAVASEIESGNAGSDKVPEENVLEKYVDRRIKDLIPDVDKTTRESATSFLTGRLQEGGTPDEIASDLRKHFDDFPRWRSERIARTEAQTAYNAATALTARAMDSNQLLAHDASDGHDHFTDKECIDRHGKVFTVRQAVRENEDEHPNGTLYFTIVPPGIKVETDSEGHATNLASYDLDTKTIHLSDELDGDTKIQYIKEVLCKLEQ